MKNAISAKAFNQQQAQSWAEHLAKLQANNLQPRPGERERYFPQVPVNYGYVLQASCNITWKKRKSDFSI